MSFDHALRPDDLAFNQTADQHAPTSACAPMHQQSEVSPTLLQSLAEWLPRLGTVLWIARSERGAPDHAPSTRGNGLLLLQHSAARALACCQMIRAHTAITSQGPREWISLHDEQQHAFARIFLLPDTDCLAWDQMTRALGLVPIEQCNFEPPAHSNLLRRALNCFSHRWQARLLNFEFRQLPWLQTMTARAPMRISLLGLDVARSLVRNENAEWVSPRDID
jgi:hypothetical protein